VGKLDEFWQQLNINKKAASFDAHGFLISYTTKSFLVLVYDVIPLCAPNAPTAIAYPEDERFYENPAQ